MRPLWTILLLASIQIACAVPNPTKDQRLGKDYVAPSIPESRIVRDVAYHKWGRNKLDLYFPKKQNKGVIIFLHAGGWVGGSYKGTSEIVRRQVSRGWVVASVGYALSKWKEGDPEVTRPFPSAIKDVKRAIRFLKARGASFGIQHLEPMVAWGESAGGHLAALAATSAGSLEPGNLWPDVALEDSSIDGAFSFAGPINLEVFAEQSVWSYLASIFLNCSNPSKASSCTKAQLREASPVTYYDINDPPVYLAFGVNDTVSPQTVGWPLCLAYAGTERESYCWFDLVDTGPHRGHNIGSSVNMNAIDFGLALLVQMAREE